MTEVTRPAMADDSGDFISGTTVNKAFIDTIFDEIDAQVHSATNPTVTPAEITDEVIEARGSMPSLDARLDVSLNEDGTPKSQAGLVTTADLQIMLGSRQTVLNGDMDDWSAGASAAPDNWTLAGSGATIARTGPGEADTFTFGAGKYAAKVTRVGNDTTLEEIIIPAIDFADFAEIKGRKYSIAAKVKTSVAVQARIVVDDGVTSTTSSFHTGGGTVEHLTASHTISASATKLHVRLEVLSSNGSAYVGGFQGVFADVAPSDWQPLSHEVDATSVRRGLVSVGVQEFAGVKIFNDPPTFYPGVQASALAAMSGRLHVNTTEVGNVGASGPDVLMTYSMPAGTLSENGHSLQIRMWGYTAANANNKAWQVVFGPGTPITQRTAAHNGESWAMIGTVIRKSNTQAEMFWEARSAAAAGVAVADHDIQRVLIGGLDFDGSATTIAVQSTVSTANDDVVQSGMLIEVNG